MAGIAVLIPFVLLQIGAGWIFDAPRFALFDAYERLCPRILDSTPVVIVAIDDASLQAIGQWPWPRQIDAALVTRILQSHPAALGIDLLWPEPDRQSPEQWIAQAGPLPADLEAAIHALPSHDGLLREALGAGPVVLGLHGLRVDSEPPDTGKLAPFRLIGPSNDPSTLVPSFTGARRSLTELDRAAQGHGLLSADPDPGGVFRRLPLLALISNRLAPALGLEMLRLAAKVDVIDLFSGRRGIEGVRVGPLTLPTQADGSVWIDFTTHDPRRFVSASEVLAGRVSADVFEQKLVLIGVTGVGEVDDRMTPLGTMPGTEIHAQLLENLLGERLARRPAWTRWVEPALTLGFGLLLIALLPVTRRLSQASLVLLPMTILGSGGYAAWDRGRLLIDVATPTIGLVGVLLALLAGSLAEADGQRRRLRREVALRRLDAARAEGELEAGRRIQMGILPQAAALPVDSRYDLDALMHPARQIGGDLYDFFPIDSDHLFLAVGDVSGKGVPASLFMALGKSLCKSCALRGETDIGAIVTRANAEIARDNPEMLFITLFAGILDLNNGSLRFCNAGHDAAFVCRAGEHPQDLAGEGGPPLCVLEDFVYPTEHFQLTPGDLLCLTTDGISEAMNEAGDLIGRERVRSILKEIPAGVGAQAVIDRLSEAVGEFVAGAEASDDITILAIRWCGNDLSER
jgi:serine phosphatase RsbU (regulator of sigma subunit)/CHASE2 domain-containing sensor protein